MAPRKPKTTEKPSDNVSEKEVIREPVDKPEVEPTEVKAPETVSEKELIKVMNTTIYPKVNPRNGFVFQPSIVAQDVVRDSWVEVQLKAGILKEVE